ncbi:hypothetical protein K0M31_003866 [Melipona bicolor]|uniref:Uncharacterized protein n=1 Tax=Melipona bicolor TaxID=60889 RepID=A0AA40KP09_9HYME|nr:hypothetical protein K0M31_003866 [Melipona bicolor]
MERAAADGGGGAVYPHGALHAPVRAPDGELGDGPRYPRGPCSSRTFRRALSLCLNPRRAALSRVSRVHL